MVTIHLRDGSTVRVPSAIAQNVILTDQTGASSVAAYQAPPTREGIASGLEGFQTTMGGAEIVFASDIPPLAAGAGALGELSGIGALGLAPNKERLLNVATLGLFKGAKVAANGVKDASQFIHKLQQIGEFKDILDKMEKSREEQAQEREREKQRERQRERDRNNLSQ